MGVAINGNDLSAQGDHGRDVPRASDPLCPAHPRHLCQRERTRSRRSGTHSRTRTLDIDRRNAPVRWATSSSIRCCPSGDSSGSSWRTRAPARRAAADHDLNRRATRDMWNWPGALADLGGRHRILVVGASALLRRGARANLGLLASRAAHRAPPDTALGLPPAHESAGTTDNMAPPLTSSWQGADPTQFRGGGGTAVSARRAIGEQRVRRAPTTSPARARPAPPEQEDPTHDQSHQHHERDDTLRDEESGAPSIIPERKRAARV